MAYKLTKTAVVCARINRMKKKDKIRLIDFLKLSAGCDIWLELR